uniref:Glucosylceramidase n=1 Tax=Angiostrongylus cantonensis TaxID=6313 RepID=A0A158PAK6_ANGCA
MCGGLYPRSWTLFDVKDVNVKVIIRQVSPVLPNNYEDSSLPVSCFVVTVQNDSAVDLEVSIAFTFRNGTGNRRWENESECTFAKFTDGNVSGITLAHTISHLPCTYGIATSYSDDYSSHVSVCHGFDPSKSGAAVWNSLLNTGDLPVQDDECPTSPSELAVGVCNRLLLPSKSSRTAVYALAWDMPDVVFGASKRWYKRRYTRFVRGASCLCSRALSRLVQWERALDEWQNPILEHPNLPDWYKSAIFNELYFITDGGSLWFEFDDEWSKHETHLSDYTKGLMRQYGRFGYLESWEYRMVNTYDVHFYASFALAQLWPNIELTLQAEFTDQIEHSVDTHITFHMEGDVARQKTSSRVPHDLGNPADEPWLCTNAYVMHDTGKWKDLNLKFVLVSWRDHIALPRSLNDFSLLEHTWPAVQKLISEAVLHWDQDGDGMIENFGRADQTYDAWRMEGVSAYCGSLWLASLRVAAEMAHCLGYGECEKLYMDMLTRARKVFIDRLWTGSYFRFCERSRSRESIMADQLCGVWFLQSVSPHLAADVCSILPNHMVRSALNKIYDFNVCQFASGKMGAVNGMHPDGRVDREYIQADEAWTGVTYAVAAFLLQQGEVDKAFHTASGCYEACFERAGLQYQTPEAIYETRFYRAIGYMRPLSIWAMQWAINRHCDLSLLKYGMPSNEKMQLSIKKLVRIRAGDDSTSEGYASEERDGEAATSSNSGIGEDNNSTNSVCLR